MSDPDTMIIICPSCSTANRVPKDWLPAGGKCGRCGSVLFQNQPFTLTAANFDAHAAKSDIPLLADFRASWCGPCQKMAPAFTAAASQLEPSVRLGKVDTEVEQGVAARYNIRAIPTLILFSKGREVARQSGAMPTTAIVAWVRQALPA
jgi:thioredoxin 2